MNTLIIQPKSYDYEVKGVRASQPYTQTDFIVDGVGLGEIFDFEKDRPWFGQTRFETSEKTRKIYLDQLLGHSESDNQFKTKRYVLYGCHCGCDYCGVLSCRIERTDNSVFWKDIRYEDDTESGVYDMGSQTIEMFEFELNQYDQTIIQYFEFLSGQ
ncbi:MAG: hypothetical protein RLZZ143_2043 [Cyanobacteriota bacterium]|jgi:hypothetical protein